jgi:hypothetical protein
LNNLKNDFSNINLSSTLISMSKVPTTSPKIVAKGHEGSEISIQNIPTTEEKPVPAPTTESPPPLPSKPKTTTEEKKPTTEEKPVPAPKTISTKEISKSVPPLPSKPVSTKPNEIQKEINDLTVKIKNHLKKFDDIEKDISNEPINTLNLGNISISRNCMLHLLSGDPTFLGEERDKCTKEMATYTKEKKINLDALFESFKLSDCTNFDENTKNYKNLYGFNISMVKFIADDPKFNTAKPATQQTLIGNIQNFITKTIDYLQSYMEKCEVINDKLITSSYNLLYLLNALSIHHANVGKGIEDVKSLYNKITTLIKQNIGFYNNIDKSKLEGVINRTASAELNSLYGQLENRLRLLEAQTKTLDENIKKINTDATILEKLASEDVTNIIKSQTKPPQLPPRTKPTK